MKHYGVLTYYNSDDGVWLVCSEKERNPHPMCWETKLTDYYGSLDEAVALFAAHLKEAHSSEEAS